MLPKWHRKAVVCAGHHFSDTFDSISKKTQRLAHFLLGAGPILHAFLLQACSPHSTQGPICFMQIAFIQSALAGTNASVVADLANRKHCGHPRTHRTACNFPTHLPVHFGVRRRPFSDQFNVWVNHNPAAAVCGDQQQHTQAIKQSSHVYQA